MERDRNFQNFSKRLRLVSQWLFLLLATSFINGCVSKSAAQAQAHTAFLAGQQQAMIARQSQQQGPTITVLGEVRNQMVPWTVDLTLAKAVVEAGFYGRTDPTQIIIQRDGKEIQCDPKRLLTGDDVALQPNDVIILRQ